MRTLSAAILALALAAGAAASDFPAKPIRIVVPNPAGGTVDIVARLAAQSMGAALGQPVVVELRPGGDTLIGTNAVARANPDGYTLVMVGTPFALNAVTRKLPYEPFKDFRQLARLVTLPTVIAVHPSLAVKSLDELVALAKANPAELHYAAFATAQITAEMFKQLAGIEMERVPYQGGVQATAAVAGGHVKVLFGPLSDATPHIAAGRLRPLAVTSRQRSEALKEIPTVAESGYPGFEFVSWIGAAAPAGTPEAIAERLSAEMLRALDTPRAKATLAQLSVSPAPLGGPEFAAFIREETKRYEAVIRRARLTFE